MVSLSPHLQAAHSSSMPTFSRWRSDAQCTKSLAAREALAMVSMSPCCSIAKLCTGLPVTAIASATLLVHSGSMPITTQAATLGLRPVPMMVRKCRSRSSPNCSRP